MVVENSWASAQTAERFKIFDYIIFDKNEGKMCSPRLTSEAHFIEAHDYFLKRNERFSDCEMEKTHLHRNDVIESEKRFGLIGRDIIHVNHIIQLEYLNFNYIFTSCERPTCDNELNQMPKPRFSKLHKSHQP